MGTLDIDAERCVHQQVAGARCQACVDHCPRAAWRLHAGGLGFDDAACDDCGLCVAACPTEALRLAAPAVRIATDADGRRTLMLACDRAGVPAQGDATPCLYALSPGWLLRQCQAQRASAIAVTAGDCAQCPRGGAGPAWRGQWQALAGRWAAPPVTALPADAWLARADAPALPNPGRRRWLARLAEPPRGNAAAAAPATAPLSSARAWTVAHLRADGTPAQPPLWSVALDAARCTACLACTRLCPTGALATNATDHEDGEPAECLTLDMHRCTGCGLCEAVCDSGALSAPFTPPLDAADAARNQPPVRHLPLRRLRCATCGHDFHRLAAAPESPPRCPACAAGRPQRHDRVIEPGAAA
jgi:ferredoxin